MNKEQYEASQTILKLSEVFVSQIRGTMIRTGLLDDGYTFRIEVMPPYEVNKGEFLKATAELTNGKCAESFCKFNYRKEGWHTIYEPEVDTEPESKVSADDGAEGRREKTEKPLAPDGLWLSSSDDTNNVLDWWPDVNDNMA